MLHAGISFYLDAKSGAGNDLIDINPERAFYIEV